MVIKCKSCDWERSSASGLAELDFMFHHGPDEGHDLAQKLNDRGVLVGIVKADYFWHNMPKKQEVLV